MRIPGRLMAMVVSIALVVVLALALGWWPLIFAVVLALPIFYGSRRSARRRFG
jgi:uncharacterized membrane protein